MSKVSDFPILTEKIIRALFDDLIWDLDHGSDVNELSEAMTVLGSLVFYIADLKGWEIDADVR